MINIDFVRAEREAVVKNISSLESQISKLNQELQQANMNLVASKGAVMGFDRILNAAQIEENLPEIPKSEG